MQLCVVFLHTSHTTYEFIEKTQLDEAYEKIKNSLKEYREFRNSDETVEIDHLSGKAVFRVSTIASCHVTYAGEQEDAAVTQAITRQAKFNKLKDELESKT